MMKTVLRIVLAIAGSGLFGSCSDMMADLQQPGVVTLPDAAPFIDYAISGSRFYGGAASAWHWTVTGGPGDQLFSQSVDVVSFTLGGADSPTLTFHPVLCGPYQVRLQVTTAEGRVLSFPALVNVRTPGLTVELCWDATGRVDLDLHMHRSGTTTPWFGPNTSSPNTDDCFYLTGAANRFFTAYNTLGWGHDASCLCLCQGDPQGTEWQAYGACPNPRLSCDNIDTVGVPEIINLDNPRDGETFRVMVHYYREISIGPQPRPLVRVFCGGQLIGSFGYPDALPGFDHSGSYAAGPMWRVVDITPQVVGGQVTGCSLTPLHPPGQTTGYWVTNNDTSY